MKIAIPVSADCGLDSPVDSRLGRAYGLLFVDAEGKAAEFIANDQNLNVPQGAGIQVAGQVADGGAQVVLAANVGPKAMSALARFGVKVFQVPPGTKAGEALRTYLNDELKEMDQASVPGHWT